MMRAQTSGGFTKRANIKGGGPTRNSAGCVTIPRDNSSFNAELLMRDPEDAVKPFSTWVAPNGKGQRWRFFVFLEAQYKGIPRIPYTHANI